MMCGKCKVDKPETDFYNKITSKGIKQSMCKPCMLETQKLRWKARKAKIIQVMGGKCTDCGYCKNHAALELHHLDPETKDYDWAKLRELKWETIINEIKKCILVCSNCHRERHNPECIDFSTNDFDTKTSVQFEIKQTGLCLQCQGPVYSSKYCSLTCSSLAHRKVVRPLPKELLKDLDSGISFLKLAAKYNVTDNTIRKWCVHYGIDPKTRTLAFPAGLEPA